MVTSGRVSGDGGVVCGGGGSLVTDDVGLAPLGWLLEEDPAAAVVAREEVLAVLVLVVVVVVAELAAVVDRIGVLELPCELDTTELVEDLVLVALLVLVVNTEVDVGEGAAVDAVVLGVGLVLSVLVLEEAGCVLELVEDPELRVADVLAEAEVVALRLKDSEPSR